MESVSRLHLVLAALLLATAWPAILHAGNCFHEAAQHYGVSATLLMAIAQVESANNPRAININRPSGTVDVGLMQINSQHLPMLAKHGIGPAHLYDACTSIHIGAWVLASAIMRFGPTWEAVGAYNAGFRPEARPVRARYAARVRAALAQLERP